MKPTDIRLIAMDMDGTLLNSHQQISVGNARVLKKASEAGVKLAICSGRMAADVAMFALENGLDDCALLGTNGTHCWLSPEGVVFADHVFASELVQAMRNVLEPAKVLFTFFAQETAVVFNDFEHTTDKWWASHRDGQHPLQVVHAENCKDISAYRVNKVVISTDDLTLLGQIRRQLEAIGGLDVSSSWVNNLEIMPLGFNKGSAVAELAAQLGLNASQVMTFGDYDNDLPMIEWAGWGVAMGNANEKIKGAARLVTLTNDEDGVGKAIEQYVLNNGN